MQQDYETEYFWRKPRLAARGRFNLLLLEYGEIFYENLSVFQYPVPNHSLKFAECDALKVKGRLHVCSRSIIFEPTDVKRPLLKFQYKSITSDLENFRLKPEEIMQCSVTASGFATFRCSGYFEMKENDQVGSYKHIDCSSSHYQNDSGKVLCTESSFVFALVHTDSSAFFLKIRRLRDELAGNLKGEGLISLRSQQMPQKPNCFDSSQLVDFHEQLLFSEPISAVRVGPLVLHPGGLMVTGTRIYFQPSCLNNIGDSVQHFDVRKIKRIFSRRYLLRQTGMEIFFADGGSNNDSSKSLSSVYFVFESIEIRDHIVATIEGLPTYPNEVRNREKSILSTTKKWQKKEITNLDYLLFLNSEADRSFNDLTQYPVMPHILADYHSRKLDLTKPETFRDLSKPVGALNSQRLSFFKERFNSMSSVATEATANGVIPFPPPFLYGTHYSTPGYVLYYLVRVAPEHMLCLQNGKFDAADRMFHSVAGMFSSCLSNPADLKELIPEFFHGEGEFLSNNEGLNLGRRHNGDRVDDVELPPWAKNPKDFIKKSRLALESDYVSERLHHWIDLIFGYKQRGEAALLADNLFYHLTYEGSLDLDSDLSPPTSSSVSDGQNRKIMEREAIDVQIQEFGQTPKQLFSTPHPQRGHIENTTDPGPVLVLGPERINKCLGDKTGLLQEVETLDPSKSAVDSLRSPVGRSVSVAQKAAEENPAQVSRLPCPSRVDCDAKAEERVINNSQSRNNSSSNSSIIGGSSNSSGGVPSTSSDFAASTAVTSSASENTSDEVNTVSPSIIDNNYFQSNHQNKKYENTSENNQERSLEGMTLLKDNFRAEVSRELAAKEFPPDRRSFSPTQLGGLVVNTKGSTSLSEKNDTRRIAGPNEAGISGKEASATPDSGMEGPESRPQTTPSHMKYRMQSLWGSISEKATSLMTPKKGGTAPPVCVPSDPIHPLKGILPPFSPPRDLKVKEEIDTKYQLENDVNDSVREGGSACSYEASVKVTLQLCRQHQLPRKTPVTGISALQINSEGRDRIITCCTTKDCAVSVFHCDVPFEDDGEDRKDTPVEGGWRSIGESDCRDKDGNAGLDLIASFTAGVGNPTAPSVFRPLGLLPHIISSAFSVQHTNAPFNSCCRLSTDATKVLISSQWALHCSLYSHSIPDGRIMEQNCIRIDNGLVLNSKTNTCIAFGRGSQCLVSGSHDGTVRLWALALSPPIPPGPSTRYGVSNGGHSGEGGMHHAVGKEERKQKAVAEFIEVQSPILCVTHTISPSALAEKHGTSATTTSSSSSSSSKLLVAAGALDGTVAVWTADVLTRCNKMEAANCKLLFCHQLRPSERSVVCVEWLQSRMMDPLAHTGSRSTDSATNTKQQQLLVLLTGAADGALHCVDSSGRVLAICEVLGNEDDRSNSGSNDFEDSSASHLTAMVVSHSCVLPTHASSSSSSFVFCGFSDGSVHVVSLVRTFVQITRTSSREQVRSDLADGVENSSKSEKSNVMEGDTRELIQMVVVLVVPAVVQIPQHVRFGITAMCWIVSTARGLKVSSRSGSKDVLAPHSVGRRARSETITEMGTLVTGDGEGFLRVFRLATTMPSSAIP